MTDQQLETLVARIGDEMLSRLGLSNSAGLESPREASAPACGCQIDVDASVAPHAVERPPGWNPALLELDCRDARHTTADISARCLTARSLGLGAVGVLPTQVAPAERSLRGSDVRITASLGWPHGAASMTAKAVEAELALSQGAADIETVVPAATLLGGQDDLVFAELRLIADLAHKAGKTAAAVVETGPLDESRLVTAGALARLAQMDAVCAASGLTDHAVLSEDAVRLFRRVVGDHAEVRACGGADSAPAALSLIRAGASCVSVTNLKAATALSSFTDNR